MATIAMTVMANAYDIEYPLPPESSESFIQTATQAERAGLDKIHKTVSWTYDTGPVELSVCPNGLRVAIWPVTDINGYIIGDITAREVGTL